MDASSWLIYLPSGRQRSFASWQSTHRKHQKKKGGKHEWQAIGFFVQKLQLTLAWLRASLRASDNLQDTFAAVENAFRYNELPWRQRVLIIVEALSDAPCPRFLFTNMWYPRRSGTTGIAFVFYLFASCFIALQTLPDHLNIRIKAYLPYCTCGWHSSCIRQAGFTPSSWPSILSCASNAKQSKFFVPTLVSLKLSLGSKCRSETFTWLSHGRMRCHQIGQGTMTFKTCLCERVTHLGRPSLMIEMLNSCWSCFSSQMTIQCGSQGGLALKRWRLYRLIYSHHSWFT